MAARAGRSVPVRSCAFEHVGRAVRSYAFEHVDARCDHASDCCPFQRSRNVGLVLLPVSNVPPSARLSPASIVSQYARGYCALQTHRNSRVRDLFGTRFERVAIHASVVARFRGHKTCAWSCCNAREVYCPFQSCRNAREVYCPVSNVSQDARGYCPFQTHRSSCVRDLFGAGFKRVAMRGLPPVSDASQFTRARSVWRPFKPVAMQAIFTARFKRVAMRASCCTFHTSARDSSTENCQAGVLLLVANE